MVSCTKSLKELQRRFDRLKTLQQRLVHPAPKHLVACGRRYDLPLRAKAAQAFTTCPPRVLDYLSGFFDGDGTVVADGRGLRLGMSQAKSNSTTLLLFRNVLGGGIYTNGRSVGMAQSMLQWALTGGRAQHAAGVLSQSSSCKYDQLLLCRSGSRDSSAMKTLKTVAPSRAVCPSWSYLAGFFDAEGHIKIDYPASMSLQIGQKFPDILHSIRDFLLKNSGAKCSIYSTSRGHHLLTVSGTAECKSILRRLLIEGLRAKRETATISIALTQGNFHDIRDMLAKRVGYQARYVRLTAAGTERAYEIRKLRAQLALLGGSTASEGTLRNQLLLQLEQRQESHRIKCAAERCQLLRADIRTQLHQENARVQSSESPYWFAASYRAFGEFPWEPWLPVV